MSTPKALIFAATSALAIVGPLAVMLRNGIDRPAVQALLLLAAVGIGATMFREANTR